MPQKSRSSAAPAFFDDTVIPRPNAPAQPGAQNLKFIEHQYALYLHDREAVSPDWREYFNDMQVDGEPPSPQDLELPFQPTSIFHRVESPTVESSSESAILQERIDQLIRNYRVRGHIIAQIDPLGATRPHPPELDPGFYGFNDQHMRMEFSTECFGGAQRRTLEELLDWLKTTYCRSIGVQFMHIDSLQVRSWLMERMESTGNHIRLKHDEQIRILKRLCDAVTFEEFVQKKYVGAKSFSLEGAESLIPLLDMAIERAGTQGIRLVVLGMAHRGRLNVLSNIMGKRASQIFREFEDRNPERNMGRGDVKYHLGYSSDCTTESGQEVHLTLCFNPSHLEFVNPVALGRIRGKQDHVGDYERRKSMGILIHGDAAFAGEGLAQETLNLSELSGYRTGGTLHIIVNNQIGFTTSASEGRSCTYATDVARMLQIPIFHVNGEDPEAVAQVVQLAMDFRERFQRDVVIDMYCFRRRGHNEGDEPAFTQPAMYDIIRRRKSVYESFLESMLTLNEVTREEADEIMARRGRLLEDELAEARKDEYAHLTDSRGGTWDPYFGGSVQDADKVDTGVDESKFCKMMRSVVTPPDDFTPHPRLKRMLEQRQQMVNGAAPFDWGTAEIAAFATVVADGEQLRFSGQDVKRGTFSHRHSVLVDSTNGSAWTGLEAVAAQKELVEIHNSPLSEIGVLGFEYGYSLDRPSGLTVWEAQFGDFVNAAQVIIDQFISSAEDKWDRLSGLVMLLPHGFEGQGPEHSSARIERFLTLAAEDNMQIVVPSTPAQHFHLLRRQFLRRWRKPLVVMTPKSLLRHKAAVSDLAELTEGRFHEVIPDAVADPKSVKRVLLCSGKIYYELDAIRRAENRNDIAIVRLEQLYPLPKDELVKCLSVYAAETPVVWIQEEPENMGAWVFLRFRFGLAIAGHPLTGISRPQSASAATGSGTSHKIEQQLIHEEAFEVK
ncbi:MAG: 2-oxoglutarate dehydrogenase E1 component [Planctomycetaceae bacterium]|jgi:2-oxoglutarate dehydrogenase E1 component